MARRVFGLRRLRRPLRRAVGYVGRPIARLHRRAVGEERRGGRESGGEVIESRHRRRDLQAAHALVEPADAPIGGVAAGRSRALLITARPRRHRVARMRVHVAAAASLAARAATCHRTRPAAAEADGLAPKALISRRRRTQQASGGPYASSGSNSGSTAQLDPQQVAAGLPRRANESQYRACIVHRKHRVGWLGDCGLGSALLHRIRRRLLLLA